MNKPLYRIAGLTLAVAAILFVIQTVGCTPVTNFREYRITKLSDNSPEGVSIYIHFSPTRHTSVKIPGVYDCDEYSEPYRCNFTIWGPFEKITHIDSRISINNEQSIPIDLDVALLNDKRKLSRNGSPLFPAGRIPFDAAAEDIQSVQFETSFSAIVDGEEQTYSITNQYGIKLRDETGNRMWSALMGI